MNIASQWRIDAAKKLAALYSAFPQVEAVMVSGSTARGHADQFSDIELGVFWVEAPTEEQRGQVVSQAGADLLHLYTYDVAEAAWYDAFWLGRSTEDEPRSGVFVEIVHSLSTSTENILGKVLDAHDPNPNLLNSVAGVIHAWPLHGGALIEGWQARASVYPDELARAVIRRHAIIDHFWRWQMYMQRGENCMLLYEAISQIEQRLLHILLALNKEYYFGFKWLDQVCARLVIAPPDLHGRLVSVFVLDVPLAVKEMQALVEETFQLVEQHYPDLVQPLWRDAFYYQRPLWGDEPPPE